MRSWYSILKNAAFSAAVFCATSPLFLMAQQAEEKTEAKASPWVMSYIMFTLTLCLGIAVLSIPTKRRDKPRLDD